MGKLLINAVLALVAGCSTVPAPPEPTPVMVIAAIHSAHKEHPRYSYDDLFDAVSSFSPDVVAVEIRQEDLGEDADYLERNYPFEMVELARRYSPRVRGIDWLGEELEGRRVPERWWQDRSWVKRLERERSEDLSAGTPRADALQKQQRSIRGVASAASLNDGRYDSISRAYYRVLAEELAGTSYARLVAFYAERDRRIARSVRQVVENNPGRRIAFVVGADHRASVVDELARLPSQSLLVVPVR